MNSKYIPEYIAPGTGWGARAVTRMTPFTRTRRWRAGGTGCKQIKILFESDPTKVRVAPLISGDPWATPPCHNRLARREPMSALEWVDDCSDNDSDGGPDRPTDEEVEQDLLALVDVDPEKMYKGVDELLRKQGTQEYHRLKLAGFVTNENQRDPTAEHARAFWDKCRSEMGCSQRTFNQAVLHAHQANIINITNVGASPGTVRQVAAAGAAAGVAAGLQAGARAMAREAAAALIQEERARAMAGDRPLCMYCLKPKQNDGYCRIRNCPRPKRKRATREEMAALKSKRQKSKSSD